MEMTGTKRNILLFVRRPQPVLPEYLPGSQVSSSSIGSQLTGKGGAERPSTIVL